MLSHVNDNLNRVQLVPQGTFWCTSLWLDCGEWWVFPVFKPTYGLSKAVAEGLLFSFTTSSFLFHRLSLFCFSWLCCQNTDQSFGSLFGKSFFLSSNMFLFYSFIIVISWFPNMNPLRNPLDRLISCLVCIFTAHFSYLI